MQKICLVIFVQLNLIYLILGLIFPSPQVYSTGIFRTYMMKISYYFFFNLNELQQIYHLIFLHWDHSHQLPQPSNQFLLQQKRNTNSHLFFVI